MATTSELKAYLAELYAQRTAILSAQSYTVSGRALTRVALAEVTKEITKTETKIYKRENNGSASVRVRFCRGGRG